MSSGRSSKEVALAVIVIVVLVTLALAGNAAAGFVVLTFSALLLAVLLLGSMRRAVLTFAAVFVKAPPIPAPPKKWPKITVFVPAHNEANVIGKCLTSLAYMDYPKEKYEVVVIDDASTDDTGKIGESFHDRISNLFVYSRDETDGACGKAAALNDALARFADQDLCYFLDADAIAAPDVLKRAAAYLQYKDVGAVTGRLEPINPDDSPASFYSAAESWTHQLTTLWPAYKLGLTGAVLGSNWAARRRIIDQYGFGEDQLLEDTALSVAMNNDGYTIVFDENMRADHEVPPNLQEYFYQHVGWARGFFDIGTQKTADIFSGAGDFFQKLDRALFAWGYFDRPLVLILILMFLENHYIAPVFYTPGNLVLFVLVMPFIQMITGLYLAGRINQAPAGILRVLAMIPVDFAAAIYAAWLELTGAPSNRYKTARCLDRAPGGYMGGPGDFGG